MEIIPVMDILNGIVVHAIKGERNNYKPVKSVLCNSSDPVQVAESFKKLGLSQLYIADLDSILGKGKNYEIIETISKSTKLEMIVDAGINNIDSAMEIFNYKISGLIIGTETLTNLDFIKECIKKFGAEKIILSLDIKDGKVLSSSQEIAMKDPSEVALTLNGMGVKKMIVLDLRRVGSEAGINWPSLNKILSTVKMKIIVGGGIRNLSDINELKKEKFMLF